MRHSNQNEGIRILAEFVCQAIPNPSLAPPPSSCCGRQGTRTSGHYSLTFSRFRLPWWDRMAD